MINRKKTKQKGLAAIFITILVLGVMFSVAVSINIVTVSQQRVSAGTVKSVQSYYTAEAGLEDALLRLKNNPSVPVLSYDLTVGGGTTQVNIPEVVGGARTISSQGNVSDKIRKVQVVYKVSTDAISFHYGAQVGDGGMEMGNNARIRGNVFSNGNVIGSNLGYIDDSIIVAHDGNKIQNLDIGGNALVHTCDNSTIDGDLTYVAGGTNSCSVGGETSQQADEIQPEDLPISSEQIDEWKTEAVAGGFIGNDVIYNAQTSSLGPVQIGTSIAPKNLTITNNSRIKIRGTVYVTGNIIFSNNSIIELDRDVYGSFSGTIIADGRITVGNNAVLRGSGETGSYILVLSTNGSLNPASPAISVSNNAAGAIFYTTSGLIYLSNNMTAREITGYKIKINNNAQIIYESGLQNAIFSSGPGGSWQVEDWKETE